MEAGSDRFYAALATVQFDDLTPFWDEFTEDQWSLLAAWARAGSGVLMVPSRDSLPLLHLRQWAPNLMVFDRTDQGWRKTMTGPAAAWLLPDQGGDSWDALPRPVHRQIQRAMNEGRPSYQRLPRRTHEDGVSTCALVLPMGERVVDRILVAAHSVPEACLETI